MVKDVSKKLFEAFLSVLPIAIIVVIIFSLQYSNFMPSGTLSLDTLLTFLISLIALVFGMALFSLGSDVAMSKVGKYIGASITKRKSLSLIIIISFILGVMITIAEPDLTVLGDLLSSFLNPWILKIVIGIGVGIFLVIGLLRIIFQKNLKLWIIFLYGVVFALACLFEGKAGDTIISLSFDSGGVTTGPVTVPFLLTFGAGVAAVRGGKNSSNDSFGVMGLCSIGPLISSMLLFLILSNFYDFSMIKNTISAENSIFHVLKLTSLEVLIAIVPILSFFLIYELIFIRIPGIELVKIMLGFIYTYVGLTVFLTSAKVGLIPVGFALGENLANPIHNNGFNYLLIILAILIGIAVVLVEPGVHILNEQVEEISGGAISKRKMLISMSVGVALAIVLAVIKELYGPFNITYYFVPLYIIALGLTFTVPDIYSAIAFDSGGVASGTMSSCFVLPFIIGIANSKNSGSGFGVIGLIALMPLICVQTLGLESIIKQKALYRMAKRRVKEANDAQIIHF